MKLIYLVVFLIVTSTAASQVKQIPDDCGTPSPLRPYVLEKRAPSAPLVTLPYLMKVFVHVFANDDGSNVAATRDDVLRQMENMRGFYAAHNICFIVSGFEQINNTDLNTHNTSTEAAEINPFLVTDHVNIFIHSALSNTAGNLNGTSYAIPNWYMSMVGTAVSSTTNLTTMAHEMGHDLGLYHTFEQFWDNMGNPTLPENVPRTGNCSNCTDNGDLLCDTEADRNEGVDASCNYTGTMRDACNNLFAPNTRNIMGYGNRACRNFFTAGQGGKARDAIAGTSTLTNAIAPDNVTVSSATYSSGRQFLLARNAITINVSSYIVQATTRMNMSAPSVRLLPGVRLSPSGDGYTKIRANTFCQ